MPKLKQKKRSLIKIERNINKTNKKKSEIINSLQEKLRAMKFEHANPQNIEDDLFIYKSEKYPEKRNLMLIFFNNSKIRIVVKEEIPVDQIIFKVENNYHQEEIPIIIQNIKFLQKILNG